MEVKDLTISFKTNQGFVRAVRGINFDLFEGETLAIVGESGSGKSVSTRAIMGILAGNGVIDKGQILYEGEDLTTIGEEDFHKLRGKKLGMIFQDPMSSLNPIMKIGRQITEAMLLNGHHLKNMKKDLVHAERVAILNVKKQVKKIQKNYDAQKLEINKEISELKKDKETDNTAKISSLKEKLSTLKVNKNSEIKENLKQIKPLVKAYKAKSKEADLEVKTFWNNEKEKSNKIVEDLLLKLEGLNKETEQAKILDLKNQISDEKERLRRVKRVTKKEAFERAIRIVKEVGIDNPEKRLKQYPFQLSGGMRQRIVIAIALTADPEILICDEPTTALDVTIQAQILELINKIKKERSLTVIFITHDLGVVANIADRIAVMYAGKIVEYGTNEEVFYNPKHPYTWALLSSMPDLNSKERLVAIPGTPPDMLYPPKGDAFAYRSEFALEIDFVEEPPFFKISDTHYAASWLLHENAPKVDKPEAITNRINDFKKRIQQEAKK
ncbi:oligopeptide/dipeptide ABC transporter ATP-binding protein [Acholeplasma granularum]|uniref:oligopeptide/dipeptide ABC transporter ATP-binding protein n=1 Tax=Acholeplasma granularum TaxID=264635 RepID=UPI001FE02490|nr:oligopeptide/dipeptide ABC transporter ATP-binding protein [Acholeplasma granularum]